MNNVIPPITDPMGRYWDQPSASEIIIDDEYALMKRATFNKLAEYNCSKPSGVYPGKMWRVDNATYHKKEVERGAYRHWLLWFGESDSPGFVSNHSRKILITEN